MDLAALLGGGDVDTGRFELASSHAEVLLADLVRLVAARAGAEKQLVDAVVSPAEAADYVASLRTTRSLPVLFDNAARLEAGPVIAMVRYLAAVAPGAVDLLPAPPAPSAAAAAVDAGAGAGVAAAPAPASASLLGSTDADRLRSDACLELVAAWCAPSTGGGAEDSLALDPRAFATAPQRKALVARLRLLAANLLQMSPLTGAGAASLTVGDFAAWYYCHLVVGWCGDDVLGDVDGLAAFYAAVGRSARVAAWSTARGKRLAGMPKLAGAAGGAGGGTGKGGKSGKGGKAAEPAGAAGATAGSGATTKAAGGPAPATAAAPAPAPAATASAAATPAAPVPAAAAVAAPAAAPRGTVCVTGANGFIASWIVAMLLDRGYVVHATVRDAGDTAKYEHLLGMPGAAERLRFFSADLLTPGSFDSAVAGCSVVYHCASPFFFVAVDPAEELVRPAVEGTRTVLRAAIAAPSVRRVVMTSSVAAVYVTRKPADHWYSDEDWSDLDLIREGKQHYAESKLLSEREAWRVMAEEVPAGRRIDLVTVCPTQTVGPLLQPHMNTSCSSILAYLNGSKKTIENKAKCFVDVRDVAQCHILAGETPSASGRYLMIAGSMSWRTVCDVLRSTLPSAPIPREVDAGAVPYPQALASTRKPFELGVRFTPIEISLRDCALSIYGKGLLESVIAPVRDARQTGGGEDDGRPGGSGVGAGAGAGAASR